MQSDQQGDEMAPAREPATISIKTEGYAFWRDNERFLIKGINYFRQRPAEGARPSYRDPIIDVLSDDVLDALTEDIKLLSELGLNTILVRGLDAGNNHSAALKLLAEAGFYVVVTLRMHETHADETFLRVHDTSADANDNLQPYYTADKVTEAFRLVDELAEHPNLLGFVVSGSSLITSKATRMAELMRASVRDIKMFLRCREGGRIIPVGVSQPDQRAIESPALQYFTAGLDPSCRIDFWALQCYRWAYKSSYQISGWKNMVERIGDIPVPMFLSEYGPNVGKSRIWQEVSCLYSPDMTSVFSGGCVYTYLESGNGYGIVEVGEDGKPRRKAGLEFEILKEEMRKVNRRAPEETFGNACNKVKYENWVGGYPERGNWWKAHPNNLPTFPGDWEKLVEEIRGVQDWELVENPSNVDGIEAAVGKLNIS